MVEAERTVQEGQQEELQAVEKQKQYKYPNEQRNEEMLNRSDFIWDEYDEPHYRRNIEILRAHPEIKNLMGPDPNTILTVCLMVTVTFATNYLVRDQPWYIFLLAAYFIGGTINHSLTLAIHEITHGLAFEKLEHNFYFSMFANLPIGFPSAMTFRKYHMEHHQYQGVVPLDTDIGTYLEAQYIKSNSKLFKFLNILFLPVFYAARPLATRQKGMNNWEYLNMFISFSFDYLVYRYISGWCVVFMLLSTLMGLGLHPMSGHFIHEHFVTSKTGQETYSYYGPLNLLMFNVGYHNEHHDFPRVPGSRLPLVKKIAPEFYDNLSSTDSYIKVLWDFIMTDGFGVFNRVRRTRETRDRAVRAFKQSLKQETTNNNNRTGAATASTTTTPATAAAAVQEELYL